MKFDIVAYKNNIVFIIIVVISITILFGVNSLSKNIKTAEAHVTNEEIEIEKLVINEIMTSNKGVYIDDNGEVYDWLELYNGSNRDIDLEGFGLSDKNNGEVKWLFPKTILPANSYLVVYLSGDNKDGLYTNFSLKEKGDELITLKSSTGKVIDSVKTVELKNNYTMFRNNKGEWGVTEDITPGYENTENGRNGFLYAEKSIESLNPLVLSEILVANEGNIVLDGKLHSYVEVMNNSEEIINLKDYYLTNNEKVLYKWRFPNIELNPGGVYLVYTSDIDSDISTSFSLKKKNGMIALTDKNGIIEKVEYSDLSNGIAYIKKDNEWIKGNNISPGYSNDTNGSIEFMRNKDIASNSLIISEVMPSNNKYMPSNGNEFYDWIELYNNSSEVINLGEYYLSTDNMDYMMFKLPDYNLEPGKYYVVMASGNTSLTGQYVHTNFKLSIGEGLFLYKEEQLIDSLYIYGIPRGDSYGRGIDFGHYYYTNPTPGYANDINGLRELATKPVFNYKPGIYNGVSNLELKIDSTGEIFYTLDGSIPNNTSTKYVEPIILNNTTVVRAVAYDSNRGISDVVTNSYIINENHSLPVMSVSLLKSDFDSISAFTYGHDIVNAHAEFYEKDSSFSLDCGFKLFGGESRTLSKKSFSLKFNSDYEGSLKYKVFDNKDIRNFNTLVLRSGSQDQNGSMIRDEFIANMLIDYGTLIAQGVKPVVLYIDGTYWGLYFIREKIDDDFIENNYNVGKGTNLVEYRYRAEEGSNVDFLNLRDYVGTHDMMVEENYDYVLNYLDVENYIDYYVMQFITNNSDLHNIRMYSNKYLDNGKIKLLLYDCDYGLIYDAQGGYIDYLQNPYTLKAQPDTTILRGLITNNRFRKRFIERVAYYIKNVWTEEHINTTYDKLYNAINGEMIRNAERWNQSFDNWTNEIRKMRTYALNRVRNVPKYTKEYFNLTEEEYNVYFA